ncbi:MAG: CBS domain-containing protein [Candidatus Omnitrophica bacterium]|nr:CBS domain-containing protein [Candidatus Omnitrophota bacterium]
MKKSTEQQIQELEEKLNSVKAQDFMTTNVVMAQEDLSLAEVADFMIKKRISGLPVSGKDGQPTGMITATDLFTLIDIIRSGSIKEDALNPKVSFAMSARIISIEKTTSLAEIIDIMKRKNIHTIPVYEDGKMVGVAGRRDVFKNFYSIAQGIASEQ